ncbi:hypothetical protein Bpfe_023007 [Biomphalaria pfeifferi]|uniref:Uncharacterized protein n=1 Tax=Biomphalaria pfeifferi TaxID=112525 RepID=A0AAD8B6G8_BIOPF|nr:hypothetical protein Bpfe_023007 [Biomphalaria pfeifferi]
MLCRVRGGSTLSLLRVAIKCRLVEVGDVLVYRRLVGHIIDFISREFDDNFRYKRGHSVLNPLDEECLPFFPPCKVKGVFWLPAGVYLAFHLATVRWMRLKVSTERKERLIPSLRRNTLGSLA